MFTLIFTLYNDKNNRNTASHWHCGSVSIIFIIISSKNQGKRFKKILICMLKFITFKLLQNEQVNFKFDFQTFFVIFQVTIHL